MEYVSLYDSSFIYETWCSFGSEILRFSREKNWNKLIELNFSLCSHVECINWSEKMGKQIGSVCVCVSVAMFE